MWKRSGEFYLAYPGDLNLHNHAFRKFKGYSGETQESVPKYTTIHHSPDLILVRKSRFRWLKDSSSIDEWKCRKTYFCDMDL